MEIRISSVGLCSHSVNDGVSPVVGSAQELYLPEPLQAISADIRWFNMIHGVNLFSSTTISSSRSHPELDEVIPGEERSNCHCLTFGLRRLVRLG